MGPVDLGGVHIPCHFRCPISLEVMRDPVTVSTGQTYDRASIESWVATGNLSCPVTRTQLKDITFIPNHNLRRLIRTWCSDHCGGAADEALLRRLLALAASSTLPEESRVAALRRLRVLGHDSDKNRRAICALGNRTFLLPLAFAAAAPAESPACLGSELALASLSLVAMMTPLSDPECSFVASRSDYLAWLARLLCGHPSAETRADCATVIEAISSRATDLRVAVGATAGVVGGLLLLLGLHGLHPPASKVAIRALFSLCLARENRELAVSAGAASSLMALVAAGDLPRDYLERALATVELLCRAEGGREAVANCTGAAAALVKVIAGEVADRAAEHAAGALVAVCASSEAVQGEALENGVWGWLLLMVQSNCTERAKRKTQTLLKLLRPTWPRRESLANSDDFQFQPPPRAVALR